MKKIRHLVNTILSAVIVALGFGSCVSQKTYDAAQEEIKLLKSENERLQSENAQLQNQLQKTVEYRERMEERKVVYGPRPSSYNEKINK